MNKNYEKENDNLVMSFSEMVNEFKERPKPQFLWNGIKRNSFGLVFGPSKSGKTIFCENLAISIAVGMKSFMGYELNGIPEKILFIGLEEFWESRVERNMNQHNHLDESLKKLMDSNFKYQSINFNQRIISQNDWNDIKNCIVASGATTVFIDSITRMNPGQLESSKDAEFLMQKLRGITYELGISMVCIHHTPKMYDSAITMDKIKGSSVFAQESDFAIGINRTSKNFRYFKNVFFRYKSDDFENVHEFQIDNNLWLEYLGDAEEDEIILRSDRRRKSDKRETIINYFDSKPDKTYTTAELIEYLTPVLSVKERMLKDYLSELEKNNKILSPEHGRYTSIVNTNYTYQ